MPGLARLDAPGVLHHIMIRGIECRKIFLNGSEKGGDHGMSEERILGDSGFVDSVLTQANEEYARLYELKRRGYDLDRIADRVARGHGFSQRGGIRRK
jgi:hypothetical protein